MAQQAKICTGHLNAIRVAVEEVSKATIVALNHVKMAATVAIGVSAVALILVVIHMIVDS